MAHFAQLGLDGQVLQVIVINNGDAPNEEAGVAFCRSLLGPDTEWRQTSYNGSIRNNFAGVGYTYDTGRDAFIPPQPAPDWTLDEDTCRWVEPA